MMDLDELKQINDRHGHFFGDRVLRGVGGLDVDLPDPSIHPSLSIGVVSYPSDGRTADELIISADGAMYASKRAGKDRVTGAPVRETGRRPTPV
jgi:GGDEF domain-containing protein